MIVFSYYAIKTIDDNKDTNDLVKNSRAYPALFIVLYIFSFIHRIYDAVNTTDSFPLYVMQCLTAPSIGFWIAIVYCLDEDMRERISNQFIPCRDIFYLFPIKKKP